MKRKMIFVVCLLLVQYSLNAQLVVQPNGHVAVGITPGETETVQSMFSVNSLGSTIAAIRMHTINTDYLNGLHISKEPCSNLSDNSHGIKCVNYHSNKPAKTIAVYAHAASAQGDMPRGRAIGVMGIAGNGVSGYNSGVVGILCTDRNGTGIYGSSNSWGDGVDVGGRWAGFFDGSIKVSGSVNTTAVNTLSDYRLKTNITPLNNKGSLESLIKMNVVEYNLKQREYDMGDTATHRAFVYEEDSPLLLNKHYGLIAQELQELYPNLVYEGGEGYLAINYVEIIPLLISSIQELKGELDAIKGTEQENKRLTDYSMSLDANVLYQNVPNPFSENTTVKCVISDDATEATLRIYDMNGHQIKSIPIAHRGLTEIEISGSSLDAGMYMYSLIVDNQLIDTKRMILTE